MFFDTQNRVKSEKKNKRVLEQITMKEETYEEHLSHLERKTVLKLEYSRFQARSRLRRDYLRKGKE